MAKSEVSMKLVIDRRVKRVVFAEAGKECVDFLFQVLCMPVGTIVSLVGEEGMEGSLGNLYESLEDLSQAYILPGKDKNALLNPDPSRRRSAPHVAFQGSFSVGISAGPTCPHCCYRVSGDARFCKSCHRRLAAEEGLVKGVVTYMVTDDLEINPMSTISTVILLNKFQVKDASDLEEKVVYLRMDQPIELLKASLQSNNVLTDLFC